MYERVLLVDLQSKLETRKKRQNNQKMMREGKVRKIHKDPGLPRFGEEKRQLERRVVVFARY